MNIKGFKADTKTEYKDKVISFIKEDDEDCFIDVITPDNSDTLRVIVLFVGCQQTMTWVCATDGVEDFINCFVIPCYLEINDENN